MSFSIVSRNSHERSTFELYFLWTELQMPQVASYCKRPAFSQLLKHFFLRFLPDHQSSWSRERQIASATLATSIISCASCTRMRSALPAIAAQHAAAVPHARVFGSGRPQIVPRKPLRDGPTYKEIVGNVIHIVCAIPEAEGHCMKLSTPRFVRVSEDSKLCLSRNRFPDQQ